MSVHTTAGDRPFFSIIIVNWNGEEFLTKSLNALYDQTFRDYEIIIVDNGSEDGSVDLIQSDHPNVKLILLEENKGYAVGNNIGAREAHGEWLVLLNNDAYPAKTCLENLLQGIQDYSDSTFFGACLIQANHPELIDGIGDVYHVSGLAWRGGYNQPVSNIPEKPVEIFSPCGAAAAFRRSAFENVGGFDEDYYSYLEDVDLGFRLRLQGLKGYLLPEAIAMHEGSASTGMGSDFTIYHGHRNLVWTYFQNMPGMFFWLYLPFHLFVNFFFIINFSIRGKGKVIWKAKWDAFLGIPKALRKRRQVQDSRKARPGDIVKSMERRWREPLIIDFLNRILQPRMEDDR